MNALKASQTITIRGYKDILQEIAKEIPNIVKTNNSFHPRISEIRTNGYTFDGECPSVGAFTPDGKLFCGGYHLKKWFSDEMAPHHDEIKAIREQHGDYKGKRGGNKSRRNTKQEKGKMLQAKRKLKKLQRQNEAMNCKLAALKMGATQEPPPTPPPVTERTIVPVVTPPAIVTAFGGRNSMHGQG